MPLQRTQFTHQTKGAFTLVEVILAVGVAAFCLLPIIAMIQLGLSRARDSVSETQAIAIMNGVITERRSLNPSNSSIIYPLPPLSPTPVNTNGTFGIDADGLSTGATLTNAIYRVDYAITSPGTNSRGPWITSVKVSWPANATLPAGRVETVTSVPQP